MTPEDMEVKILHLDQERITLLSIFQAERDEALIKLGKQSLEAYQMELRRQAIEAHYDQQIALILNGAK